MESSGAAVPAHGREEERPSWTGVTVLTAVALVVGGIALYLALSLIVWLGLLPADVSPLDLGTRWNGGDTWALLASFGWIALPCLALGWFVAWTIAGWKKGWHVRSWPVALAIAIGVGAGSDDSKVVAFALVVVVARNVALVPAGERTQPSRSRTVAVAAGALAVALLAFSYHPFHPIAAGFEGGGHGDRGTFGFMLENEGLAPLTIRSVRADWLSPGHDVAVEGRVAGRAYRRMPGIELGRGETLDGRMRLLGQPCPARSLSTYGWVIVRYEVLGVARTQVFRVQPPARLRCP